VAVDKGETVALLPLDPDALARQLQEEIRRITGKTVAVIINDSHGRPFREGTVGVAIGVAGPRPADDQRGRADLSGYIVHATMVGLADQLAAAASLVMGQTNEALPMVILRGIPYHPQESTSREMIRADLLTIPSHAPLPQ